MNTTRASIELYGIGHGITQDDKKIPGAKLPTRREVLRSFMAHYNEESKKNSVSKERAAKATFLEVRPHYEKAGIPHQAEKNCTRLIKHLHEKDYVNNIVKIKKDKRSQPFAIEKVRIFNEMLDKTMPFWPKNVRATRARILQITKLFT